MTPTTKAQAQDKLSKYMTKIGYPDKWRDYGKLEVKAGDAIGNSQRSARFEWNRIAAKAGKPVDRSEWSMTPPTVCRARRWRRSQSLARPARSQRAAMRMNGRPSPSE